MKIILFAFGGIMLFNEILVLNYEAVIITGFAIVLYLISQNLRPIFQQFFDTTKEAITSEINAILAEKINITNKNIQNLKNILIKYENNKQ